MWLLERCHPRGGFFASTGTPVPDLLSTATALHALVGDARTARRPGRAVPRLRGLALDQPRRILRHLGRRRPPTASTPTTRCCRLVTSVSSSHDDGGPSTPRRNRATARPASARSASRAGPLGRPPCEQRALDGDCDPRASSRRRERRQRHEVRRTARVVRARRRRLARRITRTSTAAGETRFAAGATSARRRSCGRRSRRSAAAPMPQSPERASGSIARQEASNAGCPARRDSATVREGSHVLRADPRRCSHSPESSAQSDSTAWRSIPQLPFELAALPHGWFQHLSLPVVSYALPALIAIGQVRHHFAPTRNPVARLLRERVRHRTLRVLREMQPESGGYLEATPLTSFVVMSLAGMARDDQPCRRSRRGLSAGSRCVPMAAGRSTPTSPPGSRRSQPVR